MSFNGLRLWPLDGRTAVSAQLGAAAAERRSRHFGAQLSPVAVREGGQGPGTPKQHAVHWGGGHDGHAHGGTAQSRQQSRTKDVACFGLRGGVHHVGGVDGARVQHPLVHVGAHGAVAVRPKVFLRDADGQPGRSRPPRCGWGRCQSWPKGCWGRALAAKRWTGRRAWWPSERKGALRLCGLRPPQSGPDASPGALCGTPEASAIGFFAVDLAEFANQVLHRHLEGAVKSQATPEDVLAAGHFVGKAHFWRLC